MLGNGCVQNLDLLVSGIDHLAEFTVVWHKLILSTLILFDDAGHSIILDISVFDELSEVSDITGKFSVPSMSVGDLLSESTIFGVFFSKLKSKSVLVQF